VGYFEGTLEPFNFVEGTLDFVERFEGSVERFEGLRG
jgi:hypothetical protein